MKYKIPFELVIKAYLEARVHKRSKVSHTAFAVNLHENLYKLWQDLQNGTYEIGRSICFVVSRPKHREVFAADFRDRIVHHLIMHYLMPVFERIFIRNSFSCMKGRGTLDGVFQLKKAMDKRKNGYVAKFDISGFFMNIDKNILLKKLLRLIKNDSEMKMLLKANPDMYGLLVDLIVKVTLHQPAKNCEIRGGTGLWKFIPDNKSLFKLPDNKGMAIGNLTSQLFAGFYLNHLDHVLRRKFGDGYGRYVDDFFIVAENKQDILDMIPVIEYELTKIGLTLHKDKRYIQPVWHGCKFIGSVVKKSRIYLGNSTNSNFHGKIHALNSNVNTTDLAIIKRALSTINSYLGFSKYCYSYNVKVKRLIELDPFWWSTYLKVNRKLSRVQFRDKYKILNYVNI